MIDHTTILTGSELPPNINECQHRERDCLYRRDEYQPGNL